MKRIILVIVQAFFILTFVAAVSMIAAGGMFFIEELGIDYYIGIIGTVLVGDIVGVITVHGMSSLFALMEEE